MILSQSSKNEADPLSEVLAVLGAQSVRRTRLEASGDWALAFPARQRLKFVALLRGECWVLPSGQAPQQLARGDVFLIGDTAYAVASDPGVAPIDGTVLYSEPGQDVGRLGGDDTVMLGGGIAFANEDARFLLDALPTFMRVDRSSPSAAVVAGTLDLLDREVGRSRPGGTLVAAHLAEILLVEAIRAHIADQGEGIVGWIGALGDRRIGEALGLMHRRVAHPWTVEELASQAGMSRSAFSLRFRDRVGRPPLDYLTHWRMVLARQLLSDGEGTIATVAAQVGYTSQSAFGHAFKRTFGHSPRCTDSLLLDVLPPDNELSQGLFRNAAAAAA